MSQFSLSQNSPAATPFTFTFEEKEWSVFPVDLQAIAAQLEPWVVKRVRRNVEQLKPLPESDDPIEWQIYHDDREATRKAIERGLYGAMTAGYQELLANSEDAFREQVYWCIRIKDPGWTRDHVKRLLADSQRYQEFNEAWIAFNYPKAKPASGGQSTSASGQQSAPSTGEPSCETPLPYTESPPQKSPECG